MFDVLCIGNALIDAFLTIHEGNEQCAVGTDGVLRITSGEKINLESSKFLMGGNAANVAVGLSRFGLKSGLAAETGSDEFSQKIMDRLKEEGVAVTLVKQTDAQASFAIALNFKGERTLFVQHVKRQHSFSLSDTKASWFYLTSLGETWHDAYRHVAEIAKANGTLLAFNPGSLQLAEGVASFRYLLPLTTILFVNKEEAEKIIGEKPGSVRTLLEKTRAQGPRFVVMTDGENGSYAMTDEGTIYHCGLSPAKDVERTGAGDAYATGFLAAVLSGEVVTEAMRWGATNSASVIEQVGAEAGLLTRSDMEKRLRAHELPIKELS